MIIHPEGAQIVDFEAISDSFNRSPKVGDDGHVQDHEMLARIVFDIPHYMLPLRTLRRTGGKWFVSDNYVTDQEIPFEVVTEIIGGIGTVAVAAESHDAADGVTDWTEDSESLEGLTIHNYAAGVAGLPHLIMQVSAGLEARLDALEAVQA